MLRQVLSVLLLLAGVSQAATIRVPGDQATIQAGIDAAAEGDTVLVAPGTYTGEGNRDLGLRGIDIVLRSESGPDSTVIDCESEARGLYIGRGETQATVVDGFTITRGEHWYGGGGIYLNNRSTPTIINCKISDCWAWKRGGGIGITGYSDATITNCTISNNVGENGYGGGIDCYLASPTISDCTIIGNSSIRPSFLANGGGISFHRTSGVISNCLILNNSADDGGGVYFNELEDYPERPTITGCTISGNSATSRGGGIAVDGFADPLIIKCTLEGNSITNNGSGGGIDIGFKAIASVENCIISGNNARNGYSGEGGGLFGSGGGTIKNCIFSDNSAYRGGGIVANGELAIVNCTITNNEAPSFGFPGGGLYFSNSSVLSLTNCIVWDNFPDEIKVVGDIAPPITYCDVLGGYAGEGNIDVDPLFENAANDNYYLSVSSPCIDIGDPAILDGCLPPGLGTDHSDLGAYGGEDNCDGPPAPPKTVRVPLDQPTIQAGLDATAAGDTVLVASGTYTGAGNKDLDFGGLDRVLLSEEGPESTIIDCEGDGRGLYFHNAETAASEVIGFTIRNGFATENGAGLRCASASPTIMNCNFIDNAAGNSAGGILCSSSDATLTNCTISGNSARIGGGIYCYSGSSARITNCTITNNSALQSGGGVRCYTSSPVITRCTITNNSTDHNGGGVYCTTESFPTLTNCTIAENSAEYGGGGYCYSASPAITNCTITRNSASASAGGMYCNNSSQPTLTNCILWEDIPGEVYVSPSSNPSLSYCDVEGSYGGVGNIDSDPLFADAPNGDYHLSRKSPCIDSGTDVGAPGEDFDGDPRPQGDGVDMGVDEYLGGEEGLELELTDYRSVYTPGDFLGITINIENTGDEPSGLTRGVFFATSPPSLDYKETLYDGRLFLIDGGATFTYKWGLKIPPVAPLGTYNAGIRIYDGDTEISSDSFDFEIQ